MRRGLIRRIAGCLLLALVPTLIFLTQFGHRFERDTGLSILYGLRGPVEAPGEALVIGLDRDTMEWLELHAANMARVSPRLGACLTPGAAGRLANVRDVSELPREVHGCLIRELVARGARVITFDILFRVAIPDEDVIFAARIAEARRVVLFERIRAEEGLVGVGNAMQMRQSPRDIFSAVARATTFFLLSAPSGNIAEGYLTRLPDFPDLRPMPETVLRLYAGLEVDAAPGVQPIWLYGPAKTVPTVTLREVFEEGAAGRLPDDLSNVAVFVGVSDPDEPGSKDHYRIPFAGAGARDIGGVELAATAFLNLLHGQEMHLPAAEQGAAIVFAFALALMLAVRLLPGSWGLISVVPLTGAYVALAFSVFVHEQVWMPFAVPVLLGTPAAALVALATRYAFARTLVTRLAPKQVAGLLLEGADADRRAAHDEPATVMFTDMVGSTGLGDRLSNVAYTRVLNHYYDTATEAIERHNGMVVEFMGDGILSLFSESVAGRDHARLACEAALALSRRLRASPPPDDGPPVRLRLRVGINSGVTATGEIGAKHRFSFKALGDTVNVAARLEEHGKQIDDGTGDVILVSHETRAASGLPVERFEDLGEVPLRGKARPTGVARLRADDPSYQPPDEPPA